MPGHTKKRTAIYARSSTDLRTTETQLESCRRVAVELDFDVTHEVLDEGVSGRIALAERPGGRELIAALNSIDIVLVYRLDRLSRSATELAELIRRFDTSGVQVWSLADLDFPSRIPSDGITHIAAFAESERIAILQRMRSGILRAATSGTWLGGPIPFGYDLDSKGAITPSVRLVAGVTEAELARSIFERLAAGSSTVKEAQRMNELGVFPGRRYSHKIVRMRRAIWLPSRINAMVRNPLYKGTHCVDIASGTIERKVAALVSSELWQSAQDRIRANRSCQPGRPFRPHLLRGLIFCDDCGLCFAATRTSTTSTNWQGVYYRCAGQVGVVEPNPKLRCRAKMIPAESLESLIWSDCVRIEPSAATATVFEERRPVVERHVKRVSVRTIETNGRKVGLVHVTYANGHERTFRFARGAGAIL